MLLNIYLVFFFIFLGNNPSVFCKVFNLSETSHHDENLIIGCLYVWHSFCLWLKVKKYNFYFPNRGGRSSGIMAGWMQFMVSGRLKALEECSEVAFPELCGTYLHLLLPLWLLNSSETILMESWAMVKCKNSQAYQLTKRDLPYNK